MVLRVFIVCWKRILYDTFQVTIKSARAEHSNNFSENDLLQEMEAKSSFDMVSSEEKDNKIKELDTVCICVY